MNWPANRNTFDIKLKNEKGSDVDPQAAVLPTEIQQQEITMFESDKQVVDQRQIYEAQPGGLPFTQHTDGTMHSVISFLQRPQVLWAAKWDKSDARHQSIGHTAPKLINIPETIITSMAKSKLDGFTSFKATAVIRLQVQSQPFVCGRLLLGAVPVPELIGSRSNWILSHVSRLQLLNHIQMDISKETEVTLRVPFISPYNSYDVISGLWSWAQVKVMVYSPLNSVEGKPIDVVVWGHFEDIELGAPTSGIVGGHMPQKAYGILAQEQAGEMTPIQPILLPNEPSASQVFDRMNTESGGQLQRFGGIGEQGLLDEIGKFVDKFWNNLGDALRIRPVTDFFKKLGKAGQGAVGAVGKFIGIGDGWAKPRLLEAGCSVVVRPAEFFATADGIDHSHVLALYNSNAIENLPDLGGTSADEMSFEFIKRMPIFIDYFTYSDGEKNAARSNYESNNLPLWQTYVSPTYFVKEGDLNIMVCSKAYPTLGNAAVTEYQPTNLHYAISCFEYWTGSLVYTFRFVKTDYHSGRVEVAYHPFTDEIDRADYCYRTIVDLREKTEVSVTIPYIAPVPWKKIETTFNPLSVSQNWEDVANFATGKLTVRAITNLMASSQVVPKAIEVLVEVRAGQDFRVSCPVKSAFLPVCLAANTLSTLDKKTEKIATEQAGMAHGTEGQTEKRTDSVEGFQAPSITGQSFDVNRPDVQSYCAGETFENYRTLTRRFGFVENIKFNSADWNGNPIANTYTLDPSQYTRAPQAFWRVVELKTAGGVSYYNAEFTTDRYVSPLSFVGSMYAFYRGGIRYKIYPDNPDDLLGVRIDGQNAVESGAQDSSPSFMSPLGIEQPLQKKLTEVQVPYYGNTYISCPWPRRPALYNELPLGRVLVGRSFKKDDRDKDVTTYVAVAAADDLDFKVFLGTPCVFARDTLAKTGADKRRIYNNVNWDVDPVSRVLLQVYPDTAKPQKWQAITFEDLRTECPK